MPGPVDKRIGKRKLGDLGEDIACRFLKKHGYRVIERNYLKKWGEIDIVARKGGKTHFIEVKSVSHVTSQGLTLKVTPETYRPEENMHSLKIRRLLKTIETYLLHRKLTGEWQLDLITVKLNMKTRVARVGLIENIVI